MARRGEWPYEDMAWEVAAAFGLPGTWTNLNVADLDTTPDTGEIRLSINALSWSFSEIEIVYTAGLDPLPSTVKVACAQLVKNAQATPALNVRAGYMDRIRLQYFSDTLLDESVRALLAPYVAQKVG